jgi:hypothetical protein
MALADVNVLGSIRQRLSRTWPKASNPRYFQASAGLAQRRDRSDFVQWRGPSSITQRRGYLGSTQRRWNSEDDTERPSSIVGYLLYDVTWALLRAMFIFVMYWLATHEQNMDLRIIYILMSIQVLQLDAAVKDYWYGSLKKGCRCTHLRHPERCYEGRSVVV